MNRTVTTTRMFRIRSLVGFVIAIFGFYVAEVAALDKDPEQAQKLLKNIAIEMVSALREPSGRDDVARVRELVDANLLPHIDFRVSSGLVLGKHWAAASEEKRLEFIEEFRSFLVRFYTQALSGYVKTREVPADLITFENDMRAKGDRQLLITSKVKQPSGDDVKVVYRLYWTDSWKVVDVSLAGVSMVRNYQTSFSSTVKNEGIDTLIGQLRARNATFDTSSIH